MLTAHIRSALTLALALAVFAGRLLDTTTGQPLTGVTIHVEGPSAATVTSDQLGRFTIKSLKSGTYTVTMQSKDVPFQRITVQLHANTTTVLDIKICSSTLDYHCGSSGGPGGA